jgi:hypothetical protein
MVIAFHNDLTNYMDLAQRCGDLTSMLTPPPSCHFDTLATNSPNQNGFLFGTRWLAQIDTCDALDCGGVPLNQIWRRSPIARRSHAHRLSDARYDLVSLYTSRPAEEVALRHSVENLVNEDYRDYMCCSSEFGYIVPSPGITFKASLTIHEVLTGGR